MYAAFIAPEVILIITGNHPGGKGGTVMCKLLTAGILAWVGGFSAMVTLVVIAFERYFAVIYPYENKRLTKERLKVRHAVIKPETCEQLGPKALISSLCVTYDKMSKFANAELINMTRALENEKVLDNNRTQDPAVFPVLGAIFVFLSKIYLVKN